MAQVLVDVKGHKDYNLMSCDSKLKEFQGEGTENGLKVVMGKQLEMIRQPELIVLINCWNICSVAQLCPTLCDSLDCQPLMLFSFWEFPGKNTEVGCHFLLQGIFPIQGLNPGLLHCRKILYCVSPQESHIKIKNLPKFLGLVKGKRKTKTQVFMTHVLDLCTLQPPQDIILVIWKV